MGSRLATLFAILALGVGADQAAAGSPPPLYMLNPHPTPGATLWIAPFPVPWDTSSAGAERWKMLNVPKSGLTTVAPLPPPVPFRAPLREGDPGNPSPRPWLGPQGLRGDSLPDVGDYVYVEDYPSPIEHPEPTYPEAARRAKVRGTVVVQGIVLRDGSVARAKVMKSVPELDQAALDCFRKWRFKPAMARGEPVPVWIAVPFRFE